MYMPYSCIKNMLREAKEMKKALPLPDFYATIGHIYLAFKGGCG